MISSPSPPYQDLLSIGSVKLSFAPTSSRDYPPNSALVSEITTPKRAPLQPPFHRKDQRLEPNKPEKPKSGRIQQRPPEPFLSWMCQGGTNLVYGRSREESCGKNRKDGQLMHGSKHSKNVWRRPWRREQFSTSGFILHATR